MEHSVQRYFFTIRGPERVEDDLNGTYLPDAAAALCYAEYTIRELRKKSGWNDPALMMFVEDSSAEDGFVIAVLPRLLKVVLVAK
jgi:hypothetical protein